jgi:hypothetical protein
LSLDERVLRDALEIGVEILFSVAGNDQEIIAGQDG